MNDPKDFIGKKVRITRIQSPQPGNRDYRVGDTIVIHSGEIANFNEHWPLIFENDVKQGVYADFEPVEEDLFLNGEAVDEIDEDPEPEEIFIDLRGMSQEFGDDAVAAFVQSARHASINCSGDPPELSKLTCLVD